MLTSHNKFKLNQRVTIFQIPVRKILAPYRKIKHAILVNKVIGAVDVVCVLQVAVVYAGVREAAGQVRAGQGLMWHLRDRHLVAELPHVLVEKVCVADVE